MRRFGLFLLSLCVLPGCPGPTGSGPPPAETCLVAPESAAIDAIHFTDESGRILDEGDALPLSFGGQGSAMALFQVALEGSGAPSCAAISIEGAYRNTRALALRAQGGNMASDTLSIVSPPASVTLTARAYDHVVTRTFSTGSLPGLPSSRIETIEIDGALLPGQIAEVRVSLDSAVLEPRNVVLTASEDLELPDFGVQTIGVDESSTVYSVRLPSTPGPIVFQAWLEGVSEDFVMLETEIVDSATLP